FLWADRVPVLRREFFDLADRRTPGETVCIPQVLNILVRRKRGDACDPEDFGFAQTVWSPRGPAGDIAGRGSRAGGGDRRRERIRKDHFAAVRERAGGLPSGIHFPGGRANRIPG